MTVFRILLVAEKEQENNKPQNMDTCSGGVRNMGEQNMWAEECAHTFVGAVTQQTKIKTHTIMV